MATVGTDFARRTVGKRWGEAKADHETTRNWLTLFGFPVGETGSLTTGVDTITGTTGVDTINAVPSTTVLGAPAATLSAYDSIDGGAGNDTLNIYNDGLANGVLPPSATVKNVETINVFNAVGTPFSAGALGTLDASKFVGATAINQNGVVAAAVTNLAAGTTAGFNDSVAAGLLVTAADNAASATVALDKVDDASSLTVQASGTGTLSTVNVTGSVVDASTDGVDPISLTVTGGNNVQSLTINSAVDANLSVGTNGKVVTAVNAAGSTGSLTFNAGGTNTDVATLATGSGDDVVGLATALSSTAKSAAVTTGAGDDTLTVSATATLGVTGQTVVVDSGAGDDEVNVTIDPNATYNVQAGVGNDSVVVSGIIKTTDKIDGGAGTDSISLDGKASLVADDYIVFNKVLTGFETLQLNTTAVTNFDGSQLASNYTTIDLANGSIATKIGAAQALVANGALTATAAGYDATTTPVTYAGTLNVTEKANGTITANANAVNLSVDASESDVAATLAGDVKSASVTLVQGVNDNGTPADASDDVLFAASATVDNSATLTDLASLTLSGNGAATVTNAASAKLVTVDASGLNSVDVDGKAAAGLTYDSSNTAAETIKLGAGIDHITLGASTYGAVDKVEGLNLVASATDAKAIDLAQSDILHVSGIAVGDTVATFTTTQTDLDLALKDAAASDKGDNLVFQLGGNTYVYHDAAATIGGTDTGTIDANDTLVELTGQVNLDLLASALVA